MNSTQRFHPDINISAIDLYKDYAYSFDIFYSSLVYQFIGESPKLDIVGFIASLGGLLGIFLRFNVFSLFEFTEILVKIFVLTFTSLKIGTWIYSWKY